MPRKRTPSPKAPANDTLDPARWRAPRSGVDRGVARWSDTDRGRLQDQFFRRLAVIAQLAEQLFRRFEQLEQLQPQRQQRISGAELFARANFLASAGDLIVTIVFADALDRRFI
jgi:gamma-glutamyl:cysteine ligase YbdK (ATP-grasp superfamily)